MVLFSNVKPGDRLVPDDGFTCMEAGVSRTVHVDEDNDLYVNCSEGKHFLDLQLNDQEELVGFEKEQPQ
jgi:hypothetical protein